MVKKIFLWVVYVLLFGFVIIGYALKENMNKYLSKMMKAQAGSEIINSGLTYADSTFNYTKNRLNYQLTLLEFGSIGCSSCKRMERVMDEIIKKYPQTVNVVFLNILKPKNQVLMKYFGVASIPTQVLLDKCGKEFFRHSEYYSIDELILQINSRIVIVR